MNTKHFFFLLFIFWVSYACSSKKSTAVQTHHLRSDSSFVINTDTSRITSDSAHHTNIKEQDTQTTITRVTHLQNGAVTRIVETLHLSDFSRHNLSQSFSRSDWLGGMSTITTEANHSESYADTSVDEQKDSRPIQQREWFWIALGLGTLVVLYLFVRKHFLR